MNSLIGKQIGNYNLISLLGRGGFADVYLAENVHFNKRVAIKVLRRGFDSVYVEQFFKEAKTLASLEHDHIIRVLDGGVDGQLPYLIMDYAPQGTLRYKHPRGSYIPLQTIIVYVKQIASALQYAHNHKKIHRDVKPENMLLNAKGEVLLSDFGLVDIARTSLSITQSTQDLMARKVVGTPEYMAPEQFQNRAKRASDQYALGIVVYEWLSGHLPFTGSFIALEYQHIHKPLPSLHEKNSKVTTAVEEVVTKALAKEPEQRFTSVQLFAEALEGASHKMQIYSHTRQGVSLNESLVLTVVKKPLKPAQPSKSIERHLTERNHSLSSIHPLGQISQVEDKTSPTNQQASFMARTASLSPLSHPTAANSLQNIEKLEQIEGDKWMRLRWFIFASAFLAPIVFSVGLFLQAPAITVMGLIPSIICLILGLLETGHFDQWYWFVGFLLLGPLTGLIYTKVNPTAKPYQPINLKQLVTVLSCLGYALFPVAIFISNWPETSNGPTWLMWYTSLGLAFSGWLLGLIHAIRSGKSLEPFLSPLVPFAGLIAVYDSSGQQGETNQNSE